MCIVRNLSEHEEVAKNYTQRKMISWEGRLEHPLEKALWKKSLYIAATLT